MSFGFGLYVVVIDVVVVGSRVYTPTLSRASVSLHFFETLSLKV